MNFEALLDAVEAVCDIPEDEFCGTAKGAKKVFAKEALIVVARGLGASVTQISHVTGLTSASISRRHDIARQKLGQHPEMTSAIYLIREKYVAGISHPRS